MIVIVSDAADQKDKPYHDAFKKKISLHYLPMPDKLFYQSEYWCIDINSLDDLLDLPHESNVCLVRGDDRNDPYRYMDEQGNFLPSLMIDVVGSCGDCE